MKDSPYIGTSPFMLGINLILAGINPIAMVVISFPMAGTNLITGTSSLKIFMGILGRISRHMGIVLGIISRLLLLTTLVVTLLGINSRIIMDLGPVLDLDIPVMDSLAILMAMEVLLILTIKSMGFIKIQGLRGIGGIKEKKDKDMIDRDKVRGLKYLIIAGAILTFLGLVFSLKTFAQLSTFSGSGGPFSSYYPKFILTSFSYYGPTSYSTTNDSSSKGNTIVTITGKVVGSYSINSNGREIKCYVHLPQQRFFSHLIFQNTWERLLK